MNKNFFVFISILFLCLLQNAKAQYFYNDIWYAKQLNKEFQALKDGHIRIVSLKSFENDGEANQDFFCEKRIDKNYTVTQTVTRSNETYQTLLTSYFNNAGLVTKTTDSSEIAVTSTEYKYDDNRNISLAKSSIRSSDAPDVITQTHEYIYDSVGKLVKMINKKNNFPVSETHFSVDDKGNIIDEVEMINNAKRKQYFYYYNEKNELTDVVHYNEKAQRLLADYMYEYNSAGLIKQLITIDAGQGDYHIWKYSYNENNLKETEKFYSKERKLIGRIEYEYK